MTALVPVSSFPMPVLKRWSLERAMPCQEEYFLILHLWHSEAGICGQRGPQDHTTYHTATSFHEVDRKV